MGSGRTLNEPRHALPDPRRALALAVCADALNVVQQPSRPVKHILLVPQRLRQDLPILQQLWVLEEARDLPEEGDGLLVELLRVSDVGGDDGVKGGSSAAGVAGRS